MNNYNAGNITVPKVGIDIANSIDLADLVDHFNMPTGLKIACIVITVILAYFLIVFLIETKWFKFKFLYSFVEFFTIKPYGYKSSQRKWESIIRNMGKFKRKYYTQSVIKADKIISSLLENLVPQFQATNFTERLRCMGLKTIKDPKKLWEAHIYTKEHLLNKEHSLTKEEVDGMLKIYEQALRDLEVIK